MGRVRHIAAEEVPAAVRPLYEHLAGSYGSYRNMAGALAHRPAALGHIVRLLADLTADPVNQRRHLEIAMCAASKLNECHYCVAHHRPHILDLGLPEETVERILEPDCPGLDEVDRLVRDYAVEVSARAPYMRDAMFERLRARFSEAQIVDLTLRVTLCAFFNRFNEALGVDVEENFAAGHAEAAD